MHRFIVLGLLISGVVAGCRRPDVSVPAPEVAAPDSAAQAQAQRDSAWRAAAEADRSARAGREIPAAVPAQPAAPDVAATDTRAAAPTTDKGVRGWRAISPATVELPPVLPLRDSAGPAVLRVQVLLERAGYSPGIVDGHWGENTRKALYWFQDAHGLPATSVVDAATFDRLVERAGGTPTLARYTLTAADVRGPFVELPGNVYERAKLDCLCYESLGELLAERFHTSESLLAQLNPGIALQAARAGTTLWVPGVAEPLAARPAVRIAELVVSKRGGYLHALDQAGRIVFHFPTTVGSKYDPSPDGEYEITRVVKDPDFHYQPKLFSDVADWKPEARLKPGPNSPVGVVWIQLSRPHVGIHGTAEPHTIGYSSSHGCVRLTNWSARQLAGAVRKGTPVRFR